MRGKNLFWRSLIFLIVLAIILVSVSVGLITDYWWFSALGLETLFLVGFKSKILLFLVGAASVFIFAGINIIVASSFVKKNYVHFGFKTLILLVISVFFGLSASSKWFTMQEYLNQTAFNVLDPIFGMDVSFYVFSLPFFNFIWGFVFTAVLVTIALTLLTYLQNLFIGLKSTNFEGPPSQSINLRKVWASFKTHSRVHVSILVALLFLLLAVKHYLARFSVMYSSSGIVVGAGYTDVVVYLRVMQILMVFAIVLAAAVIVWMAFAKRPKSMNALLYIFALYVLVLLLGPTLVPGIVQSLKVAPNEINLEAPYIENNIEFTRLAYGLDDVEEVEFPVDYDLTSAEIEGAQETIDNIRLLDWRPLTQTYKQTQGIRLYYDLSGIDIDRYEINGKYTQVMLAPRELNQRDIADSAKTWVNLHMVYTHGYGLVMSPVNSVTEQGLPDYYIQDIPPRYTIDDESIRVDEPRIYYGEIDNAYVLSNTKTREFDYPKGDTNEYVNYDGIGGVQVDGFWKKLMFAIRFRDVKILLSSDVTDESRIMFARNIRERINKLTPFLALDGDPYLVIDEGRLKWIQDAYTVTSNYPYSQKYNGINYIRNSVKVVVDAYDGDVTYYVADLTDPIIVTYTKIFPGQFRMLESLPEGLRDNLRYPEDLFKVQAEIYNNYHMEDVKVFYNKEDAWQVTSEIYGVGQQVDVEPYYVIIELPGEQEEEFVLMSSFSPRRKDNMVAWMAGRSDGEDYGKLFLYKFPKDKLVYGPLQIEANFDQDSEISEQLTLWSQQGSQVTRGNLLVIPINNSILYVEPLYIQAETGQLPQLKRVLVSDGNRVVMEESLDLALEALFGVVREKRETEDRTDDELLQDAQFYYDEILRSMSEQNWSGIGMNLDELGAVIGKLT